MKDHSAIEERCFVRDFTSRLDPKDAGARYPAAGVRCYKQKSWRLVDGVVSGA